jgi:hypothetical protein
MLKNAQITVIPGRSAAREPGTHEHRLEKQGDRPVFLGSGLGPEGRPGMTSEFFCSTARSLREHVYRTPSPLSGEGFPLDVLDKGP